MTVSRLLEDFSARETFPVKVQDVIDEIRARGVKDQIEFFHDLELDIGTISGFLKRVEFEKDGKKRFLSTITYGKLGPEMERLVCCKELLHILDPRTTVASNPEQVNLLIAKMSLPANLVDAFDDERVSNDRMAILEAVAIMFPLGARNILYKKFMEGKIGLAWIAEQAELPVMYVKSVMNGYWPDLLQMLIQRRRRVEEINEGIRKVRRRPRRVVREQEAAE